MLSLKPRWLRFSLRTLLIVLTLLVVACGVRINQIHRQRQAITAIQSFGGHVWYNDEKIGSPSQAGMISALKEFFGYRKPIWAEASGKKVKDDDLKYFVQLSSLRYLLLTDVSVTNENLSQFAALENLVALVCTRDLCHDEMLLKLEEPTIVDFQDVPLEVAIDFLSDMHNLKTVIDVNALSAADVSPSEIVVTGKSTNISLDKTLNNLLSPKGLGWIIADGKVVITTREIAEKNHQVAEQLKAAISSLTDVRID